MAGDALSVTPCARHAERTRAVEAVPGTQERMPRRVAGVVCRTHVRHRDLGPSSDVLQGTQLSQACWRRIQLAIGGAAARVGVNQMDIRDRGQ